MSDAMKVGVIGCGMLAQATHLKHLGEIPGVRLKWACDSQAETLATVAERFRPDAVTADYREVLGDPEVKAIVLATAQELRLPVIAAAAAKGIGVYCEKPMAATLTEMAEIKAVVDRHRIVFCVGHNRRSSDAMVYAREAFAAARRRTGISPWRLDRNRQERQDWPEERQMTMLIRINDDLLSWKPWAVADQVMATGPMLFEMTHFTDLACWFFERRPVSVTTVGHLRANQNVNILFEDGSLATIFMTGVGTFGYPKELYELYANGAAVVIDHLLEVRTADVLGFPGRKTFDRDPAQRGEDTEAGGIRAWLAHRRQLERRAVAEKMSPEQVLAAEIGPDKGHRRHLELFLRAVAGEGSSPCTADEAIVATRIAFAAIASLQQGQTVGLDGN